MTTLNNFFKYAEGLERPLNIIQFGCNDSIMADPLWDFLSERDPIDHCVFVDALKEYVEKSHSAWAEIEKTDNKRWMNGAICTLQERQEHLNQFLDPRLPQRKRFYYIDESMLTAMYYTGVDSDNPAVTDDFGKTNCLLFGDVAMLGLHPPQNPLVHLRGCGSFNRSHLESALKNIITKESASGPIAAALFGTDEKTQSAHISCRFVDCADINSFFDTFGMETVDLLQMDLEGYDSNIIAELRQFRVKPTFINFETRGPLSSDDPLQEVIAEAGYEIVQSREDTLIKLKDAGIV